jgi:hypothetical protein
MAGSFSVFGFFRLRLHAVIAVFSGCVFYIDTNVRSVFSNSFFSASTARLENAARRSDRRVFLSLGTLVECRDRATSFGAASGAAGVSSGASRVSSRRARRGAAMDRARVASAAEASRARIEEDLGAGESVSERVGRVFAGYRCGTMTVRLERRARA